MADAERHGLQQATITYDQTQLGLFRWFFI